MNKRIISMLIVVCMLVPILATYNLPALAAEGDLPTTLWVDPSDGNGIPVRIELNRSSGSSGGGGGCGGYPGGGGSSSSGYQLYLPGDADPAACYFSWADGLQASDGTNTYASGALPIPAPGETKTFTFTRGSSSATFQVTTYQGSATVPPIFVEIDESQGTIAAMNGDSDHETTCTGVIFIDGKEYAMPTIKGRGNSSWMIARTKKPYNVTLDAKVNLLGIDCDKTKKWSLLANCDEPSLLRDQLGYDMAHQMGIGLDSAQADVWMNGKYLGLYLVTPKYDSFVPKDGFMIENDNYKEPPVEEGGDPSFDLEGLIGQGSAYATYDYNRITVKKVGDNLLDGGVENVETLKAAGERLRVYTQEVWDAIRSDSGYNSQGKYYADYIDMRTWATMYLMQDYIKNYDFCGGSIFFHRDGQTDADKLFAGPLWDLDLGFGCPQNSTTLGSRLDLLDGTGWFVRNVADTKTSIFKMVGKHDDFMEWVERMYNIYHKVFDDAPAHLEALAAEIQASAEMNQIVTSNEQQATVHMNSQTVKQRGTEYEQVYKATNNWRDYVDNVETYTVARSAFFRDNLLSESEEGFTAAFNLDAHSSVTVYDTQDLTQEGSKNPDIAYARNAESGEIDVTGEGQINFVVNLKNGYQIKSVTVEPAENFKNLKGPADTGVENAYRITKVTGPVTIKVETQEFVCEHEFVDGVCVKCGEAAIQARFVCDEGVTVDVYKTQGADSEVFENATTAFPRNSSTGDIDISGDGQVNFVVKVAPGYQFESVTAEPAANYKNFKLPDETLVANGYRITKMTGDVTVTVKAVKTECQHDYQPKVTAATCTAQGFTTYTCSKCGDSYVSDYTAKIAHDYRNGTCAVCGEKLLNVTISSGEGASVTVFETQKADGPKVENAATANPRDGDSGLIDCSGDGQVNFQVVLADGYELESVTAEPAAAYKNLKGPADTGIENGYRITKVTGDFTIMVTVKKSACEHDYVAVVTAPTCTEAGYTTYTCAKCGDSYVADETPALGHSFGAWTVSKAATCTEKGEESRACARCGVTETREINALGHDLTTHAAKAPTCTEPGWAAYQTCSRCDYTTYAEQPALGHDYKAVVTAPTCTTAGFTTHTCTRCGSSYTDSMTAALGHDWGEGVVTRQPTETAKGERTYTCSRCGEKRTEIIPELAHVHSYTAVVTAPTCTEAGYTTHTCACGDSYTDSEIPALGHSFGDWAMSKPATCTEKGEEARTCDRCGEKETRSVAALGHDYKITVTAPTCAEAGYTTHTCSRCGDSYKDSETAALGHSFGDWAVSKAATCTEKGEETRACIRCDAKETREIDKIAHDYKNGKCTVCGEADPDYKPPVVDPFRFDDVKDAGKFYFTPVYWAYEHEPQITKGTSEKLFSPDAGCTRGQVVAFLWRAMNEPEPESTENPFEDVKEGAYYYKAVLWAVEKGITKGTSDTTFRPEQTCTRGQIVTFLYRAQDPKPELKDKTNPFKDVAKSAYYYDAVLWAAENEITKGKTATTFAPDATCTRGEIVTFLYRAEAKKEAE